MKHEQLEYVPCQYIPEVLEQGKIYVSHEFTVAIHLCACGCGEKTVTPFDKSYGWGLVVNGDKVTLTPSIGNFQIPCKSHYFLREGKIVWC